MEAASYSLFFSPVFVTAYIVTALSGSIFVRKQRYVPPPHGSFRRFDYCNMVRTRPIFFTPCPALRVCTWTPRPSLIESCIVGLRVCANSGGCYRVPAELKSLIVLFRAGKRAPCRRLWRGGYGGPLSTATALRRRSAVQALVTRIPNPFCILLYLSECCCCFCASVSLPPHAVRARPLSLRARFGRLVRRRGCNDRNQQSNGGDQRQPRLTTGAVSLRADVPGRSLQGRPQSAGDVRRRSKE